MKMKFKLILIITCGIILLLNSSFGFGENIMTCEADNCRVVTKSAIRTTLNTIDFERNNINEIYYEQVILPKKGNRLAHDVYIKYDDGKTLKVCRIHYKKDSYVQEQITKMDKLINSTNSGKIEF